MNLGGVKLVISKQMREVHQLGGPALGRIYNNTHQVHSRIGENKFSGSIFHRNQDIDQSKLCWTDELGTQGKEGSMRYQY